MQPIVEPKGFGGVRSHEEAHARTRVVARPAAPSTGMAVVVEHKFSKEVVAEYKAQFSVYDGDGSGEISHEELKLVLKQVGQEASDSVVTDMIKEYDTDGNGQISFPEFLAMMWRLQSGPTEKEIVAQMFALFDDNLDGLISLDELREAFRRAAGATGKVEVPSDDVLRAMIAEVDAGGVGQLTPADFAHVVKEAAAAAK